MSLSHSFGVKNNYGQYSVWLLADIVALGIDGGSEHCPRQEKRGITIFFSMEQDRLDNKA